MIAGIILIAVTAVAVGLYIAYSRFRRLRFVTTYAATIVAEPPAVVIRRLALIVRASRDYTYRKVGDNRLEIIHGSVEPDDVASAPAPELANAVLDVLVVTVTPVATGNRITIAGRAEPKLINAVRQAVMDAQQPDL